MRVHIEIPDERIEKIIRDEVRRRVERIVERHEEFLVRDAAYLEAVKRRDSNIQTDVVSTVFLAIDGIARWLRKSRRSVYRDVQRGDLPKPCKIGGTPRWNQSAVCEFLKSRKERA
ncbi:MAG: helix-turn-helix domain-containing protein [Verrucomicrobiales bacterium]|jgi:predicted DNA-binding transcriptional regulator AlpA|nr:helix-turn-helix domain-containing protein [Verrucomicrobiales bacterium]